MEEPEEPDWSAGSGDYPWVRSGYAYYIRVNRSANVVTVYTAGDDGRYSVPYPGHGVLLRRLRDAAGGTSRWTAGIAGSGWGWWAVCPVSTARRSTATTCSTPSLYGAVQQRGSLQPGSSTSWGTSCSHGCIRLQVADAKWIYDNKYDIAGVTIYDSDDPGPLGKPSAPLSAARYPGWDPTDPDSDNPWNKPADVTPEPKPEPDPRTEA